MKHISIAFLAGALTFAGLSYLVVQEALSHHIAQEGEVDYSKLPQVVRTAAEGILGAGPHEAEIEEADGVRLYEVESENSSREIGVLITEEGVVVEVESEIAFQDLPASLQKTLEERYPGRKYGEIERVQRHYFSVEFEDYQPEGDIRIHPTGKIETIDEGNDDDD